MITLVPLLNMFFNLFSDSNGRLNLDRSLPFVSGWGGCRLVRIVGRQELVAIAHLSVLTPSESAAQSPPPVGYLRCSGPVPSHGFIRKASNPVRIRFNTGGVK